MRRVVFPSRAGDDGDAEVMGNPGRLQRCTASRQAGRLPQASISTARCCILSVSCCIMDELTSDVCDGSGVPAPALTACSSPKHVPTQANSTPSTPTFMALGKKTNASPAISPSNTQQIATTVRVASGIVRKQITVVADARPRPSRCLGPAAVRWIETCLRRASWAPLSQIPAAWQPCAPWQGIWLRVPSGQWKCERLKPAHCTRRAPHNRSAEPRHWGMGATLLIPTLNITRSGLIGHPEPHARVAQPRKGSHGSLSRRLGQGGADRVPW